MAFLSRFDGEAPPPLDDLTVALLLLRDACPEFARIILGKKQVMMRYEATNLDLGDADYQDQVDRLVAAGLHVCGSWHGLRRSVEADPRVLHAVHLAIGERRRMAAENLILKSKERWDADAARLGPI